MGMYYELGHACVEGKYDHEDTQIHDPSSEYSVDLEIEDCQCCEVSE
jgi:hypothetical protein